MSRKIQVGNLPRSASKDLLTNYFERPYVFGDVEVVDVQIRGNHAVVELGHEKDVDHVLEIHYNKPCILAKQKLDIRRMSTDVGATHTPYEREDSFKAENQDDTDTIEVRGFSSSVSEDLLWNYFENNLRSGGGRILDFEKTEDYVHIKFEDKTVIGPVLSKSHKVQGCELHVKPLIISGSSLLLSDVPASTTEETLENYLEGQLHSEVDTVTFSQDHTKAVVDFRDDIDLEKAKQVCKQRPLAGVNMKAKGVAVTTSMLVTGVQPTLSQESVLYYFDNRNKSGGGNVEEVEMFADQGICLVHFKYPDDLRSVCNKGQHVLSEISLTVKPYHRCLGAPSGDYKPKLVIPDMMDVSAQDSQKLKIVSRRGEKKSEIESELASVHAHIDWNENPLKVSCTLSDSVAGYLTLATVWEDTVRKTLAKYTDELDVKTCPVSKDLWKEAKGKLAGYDVKDPEKTLLLYENEVIVLLAPKEEVESFWTQIQTAVGNAEKSLKRQSEVMTDTVVIKSRWELEYLQAAKFSDKMKDKCDVSVMYNHGSSELVLSGPKESLSTAKMHMFELIHNVDSQRMTLKQSKLKLLQKQAVNEQLKQRILDRGLVCALETHDDMLIIHGHDGVSRQIQSILDTMFTDLKIPISQNVSSVLKSPKWDKFQDNLREKCEGCIEVHITPDAMCIEVCTLNEPRCDVKNEIHVFLEDNAVMTKRKDFRDGLIVKYMVKYNKQEIETQIRKCRCHPKYNFEGTTVVITGTEEDVEHLLRMFADVSGRIKNRDHRKRLIGIQKFLTSTAGRECLEKLETSRKCVIQVVGGAGGRGRGRERDGATPEPQGHQDYGEVTINGNVKIRVVRGDLTEQRKDVIVVTANKNLHFRGRLHDKILDKGGREIKSDCEARIKRKGQLREGDIYLGSAGDLPCKNIAHAVIAPWDSGSGQTDTLVSVVENCLKKCDDRGFSSIVFPGLGTGQLHYPTPVAGNLIIKTIKAYFERATASSINKIILCDVNGDTLRAFEDCIQKNFGALERRGGRGHHSEREHEASRDNSRSQSPRTSGRLNIGRASITVVVGHLAKEKVDAIVDSAPADLHLKKGKCSKALLDSGGYRIQQECKDSYPDGISPGQVAVTTGGKLNCEKIYHITVNKYNRGEHDEAVECLRSSVKNCLELADGDGFTSIAIPSIGTGSMKYSSSMVAKEMFACVTRYLGNNHRSTLTTVRLVVFPGDTETVKAFQDEERKQSSSSKESVDDVEVVYRRDNNPIEVKCQGAKVTLVKAHLSREKVDVIVNSTSQDLKLDKGHASKAIFKAAGPVVQQECANNYPKGITPGQVAVTSPGNLSCKNVFHIAVAKFDSDGGEECMTGLAATITQCLTEANKLGLKSVAFPPIGTGALKYPKGWVAGKTYSCIDKYFQANPQSTVTTVRLVVFPEDEEIFQAFKREAFKRSPDAGDRGDTRQRRQENMTSFMSKEKNECVLRIYADREETIEDVKRAFDSTVDREWCSRKFEDHEVIPTLGQNQIKSIKDDFKKHSVFAHIDAEAGHIIAYGLAKDLLAVSDHVDTILRKQHKYLSLKKEAKLTRNIVRWYYSINQKEIPFADVDSMNTEKSYQKKDATFQVKNRAGKTFVIDFQKMHSYESSQPNQTTTIIRRDIIAGATGSVPSHWAKMNASDTVTLVPLAQGSQEYTKALNDFTKTLGRTPNIIKIERIQNKTLYIQYEAKLQSINIQNGNKNNVKVLWHGTDATIVPSIYTHGFNRSYSNVCMIGNGVYFAVNTQYSDGGYSRPDASGHKRMFRCLVITGQVTQGASGMKVPPKRTAANGAPVLYDSVSDNPANPSMYVIFHDCQAYPEHLITYV